MRNVVFLLTLICLTVALIGSCAKKDDITTSTPGVCSDCTPLETTSTASWNITVGSETLSGTFATNCYTTLGAISARFLFNTSVISSAHSLRSLKA